EAGGDFRPRSRALVRLPPPAGDVRGFLNGRVQLPLRPHLHRAGPRPRPRPRGCRPAPPLPCSRPVLRTGAGVDGVPVPRTRPDLLGDVCPPRRVVVDVRGLPPCHSTPLP